MKEIQIKTSESEINAIITRTIANVREELQDSPYLLEACRVLEVKGFRSSIGCIWNAVIDDLRNKVVHRSLELFNKELGFRKEIKTYEDFQDHVTDDQLIEGAYKIGVIGWEAKKVLRQAKETRHIFDGHPKSSDPSILKVMAMMEDCIKYVLSQEYPMQLIDISSFIEKLDSVDFDRNTVSVESAISDLPDLYKNELINRLFNSYINPNCSSILKSNLEFVIPILWGILAKEQKLQVIRSVDRVIQGNDKTRTNGAFEFVSLVNGSSYLSTIAKKYIITPLVEQLELALDDFTKENRLIDSLQSYSKVIPDELKSRYVASITKTYVGKIGYSNQFSRTDFYADRAAIHIPEMFQQFDDSMVECFIKTVKEDKLLRQRISNPAKYARLRTIAKILVERISKKFKGKDIIEALTKEDGEEEFWQLTKK